MKIHRNDIGIIRAVNPAMVGGPWIAGGAVVKWINGQEATPSDIDVFFHNEHQFLNTCFHMETLGYRQIYDTPNAKTYRMTGTHTDSGDPLVLIGDEILQLKASLRYIGPQVQLIKKRYFSSANEVIESFDLTCCQFATDGNQIVRGKDAVKDMRDKTLHVNKWTPGILKRIAKYYAYGYTPDKETISRLLDQETTMTMDFAGISEYDNAF